MQHASVSTTHLGFWRRRHHLVGGYFETSSAAASFCIVIYSSLCSAACLFQTCDCVCFVLDATLPASNLDEARREVLELFYDEHFVLNRSAPFLIIASKTVSLGIQVRFFTLA